MRIAHRYAGDVVFLATYLYRPVDNRLAVEFYGHFLRRKFCLAHIHGDEFCNAVLGVYLDIFDTAQSLYRHLLLVDNRIVITVFSHATYSVAAHLALAAVCIEHSHLDVGYFAVAYEYHAVRAHAEMSV